VSIYNCAQQHREAQDIIATDVDAARKSYSLGLVLRQAKCLVFRHGLELESLGTPCVSQRDRRQPSSPPKSGDTASKTNSYCHEPEHEYRRTLCIDARNIGSIGGLEQ
jgi:hypothetical protein